MAFNFLLTVDETFLNEDLKLLTLFFAEFLMRIGVSEICQRLIFCFNFLTSVYFKGTLKDIRIFATNIINFYDVSSFQSAYFGDVTRKNPENKTLLKVKISSEQKL